MLAPANNESVEASIRREGGVRAVRRVDEPRHMRPWLRSGHRVPDEAHGRRDALPSRWIEQRQGVTCLWMHVALAWRGGRTPRCGGVNWRPCRDWIRHGVASCSNVAAARRARGRWAGRAAGGGRKGLLPEDTGHLSARKLSLSCGQRCLARDGLSVPHFFHGHTGSGHGAVTAARGR